MRFDLQAGDYALGLGASLAAGSFAGRRTGPVAAALATGCTLLLVAFGAIGGGDDVGYLLARPLVALAAAIWAPAGAALRWSWRPRLATVAIVAASAGALAGHARADAPLDLTRYYTGVLAAGTAVALWYAMRLVDDPRRVLALLAALTPHYLLGIAGLLLAQRITGGAAPGAPLLFHALPAHLPADLLTCVLVAAISGPKRRSRRLEAR